MEQSKINRINELAKKAKSPEGLTPEEEAERAVLRKEYIEDVKKSLRVQLDNIDVEYPNGKVTPLKKKQ
ncbi:MAG: DUF896 domain-containing protein [Clostridiales bacterium]|nr:DUF896 domain-containing protein [Clostridiales bacterium]